MQAVILYSHGGPEALHYVRDRAVPFAGPNQVLVRVRACALSPLDVQVRQGELSDLTQLPCVPGYQISGVVEGIGPGVKEWATGDEVLCISPLSNVNGGYADLCVLYTYDLVPKPPSLTHEQSSALLSGGVRAYTALHYQMRLVMGESLLVFEGASAQGHVAIQLAAQFGARVIATASNDTEVNFIEDMNCDAVKQIVNLEDGLDRLIETILEETSGLGVDCVLGEPHRILLQQSFSLTEPESLHAHSDGVQDQGHSAVAHVLRCLAVHGRWCTSIPDLQLDPPDSKQAYLKNVSICFLFEQAWCMGATQHGRYKHMLEDLVNKATDDVVRPKVAKVFALDKIREAHHALESHSSMGVIVIKP